MQPGYSKASSNNLPAVDVLMVADFMKRNPLFVSSEQRGVKLARSSRENYGDSAVGYVQVKREEERCYVMGKITPEHKIRDKPYSVSAVIDEEEGSVEEVSCHDCAASAGGCKHVIAFLMWLHRRSEEPSPTEVESYWKKSKLSSSIGNLKPLKVKDMTGGEGVDHEGDGMFRKKLINKFREVGHFNNGLMALYEDVDCGALTLRNIMRHFQDQHGTKTPQDFLEFSQIFMENSGLCEKAYCLTKSQHECPLWHQLRCGRVSASRVHAAMHCKKGDGVLVEVILGAKKLRDTAAMQRGRILEGRVVKALEKVLGKKVEKCGLFLDPQYPVLAASPDGICEDMVIEIKCPQKEATVKNYYVDGKVTRKHLAQIMVQMLLSKKRRGLFVVADPNFEINEKLNIFNIDFCEEMKLEIIALCNDFWSKFIYPVMSE